MGGLTLAWFINSGERLRNLRIIILVVFSTVGNANMSHIYRVYSADKDSTLVVVLFIFTLCLMRGLLGLFLYTKIELKHKHVNVTVTLVGHVFTPHVRYRVHVFTTCTASCSRIHNV